MNPFNTPNDLNTGVLERPGAALAFPMVFGILLTAALIYDLPLSTGIFAAVIALPLLISQPVAIMLSLLLAAVFISPSSPLPGTAIESINMPDILLGFAFFIWGIFVLQGKRYERKPADIPLALFVLVSTLVMAVSVTQHGHNFFEVLQKYKVTLYFLLGIILPGFVRNVRDLKMLVIGVLLIGLGASARAFLQLMNEGVTIVDSLQKTYYVLANLSFGAGNSLVYACICIAAACILVEKFRFFWLGLLCCYIAYFIVMFHRHMYLAVPLALFVLVVISMKKSLNAPLKIISMVSAGVVILTFLYVNAIGGKWRYIDYTIDRFKSLQTIENTGSVTDRLRENHYAFGKILEHPVMGIGFMEHYRPPIGETDKTRHFIHNGYLWILLKMGIVGLIPFLWFSLVFLKRGLRMWRKIEHNFLSAVVLGSTVAYGGLLLCNIVSPYFMQDWETVVPAMLIGINESIFHLSGHK